MLSERNVGAKNEQRKIFIIKVASVLCVSARETNSVKFLWDFYFISRKYVFNVVVRPRRSGVCVCVCVAHCVCYNSRFNFHCYHVEQSVQHDTSQVINIFLLDHPLTCNFIFQFFEIVVCILKVLVSLLTITFIGEKKKIKIQTNSPWTHHEIYGS